MSLSFRTKFIILVLLVGLGVILVLGPSSIIIPPILKYPILGLAILISVIILAIWKRTKRQKSP